MNNICLGAKRAGGGRPFEGRLQPALPPAHPQQVVRAPRVQELEPGEGQVGGNASNAITNTNTNTRCNCFKQILPLVRELLAGERRSPAPGPGLVAANDRLLQLIIKGILYESCVDYCQQKATASKNSNSIEFTNILSQSEFNDSDLSLLSWLQSLPPDTFSCPFEQRSLNVDVERIQKPVLETSWTEHMLVTPIRSNIFPHSAMPHGKPKSTDIMTKSLSLLLSKSQDASSSSGGLLNMSKSLASFHLTGKKLMDTSVDQLFRAGEDVFTAPAPQPSSEQGGGGQGGKEGAVAAADRQKTRLVSKRANDNTNANNNINVNAR